MMHRTLFIAAGLLLAGLSLPAQSIERQVVAAAGEGVAGPAAASGVMLDQGFPRGELQFDPTAVAGVFDRLRVNVFPNPAAAVLRVDREDAGNAEWTAAVFSIDGRPVAAQQWPAGAPRLTFDLRALPAGAYVLHLPRPGTKQTAEAIPFVKTE